MVRRASVKSMKRMVQKNADMGAFVDTATMQTPLHVACLEGDLATCVILLNNKDVKVNAKDSNGCSPLLLATATRHEALPVAQPSTFACIVKLLLDHGAAVDMADHDGVAPLENAVRRSDAALLTLLLKHGANPSAVNSERQSPLMLACADDWVVGAEALVAAGADIRQRDCQGRSVLHYASTVRTAKLVVRSGAMATAVTLRKARTALHEAAAALMPDLGLVRFLVNAGCPVDALDSNGQAAKDLTTDAKVWSFLNSRSSKSSAPPRETTLQHRKKQAKVAENSPLRRNPSRKARMALTSVTNNMGSPVLRRVREGTTKFQRSPRSQRRVARNRRHLLAKLI